MKIFKYKPTQQSEYQLSASSLLAWVQHETGCSQPLALVVHVNEEPFLLAEATSRKNKRVEKVWEELRVNNMDDYDELEDGRFDISAALDDILSAMAYRDLLPPGRYRVAVESSP